MNSKIPFSAGAFALFLTANATAELNTPTINLIPVTAVESIKQSASTAKNMESALGGVLERIDSQKALYDSAKCDGADSDQGCEQIFKNLSASYRELLESLNSELPDLSAQLNTTAQSIGTQLRKELGKNMTPVDVQRLIGGKTANGKRKLQARKGNNSHNMLKWLNGLGKAISSGGYGESTAVTASDIYVNMTLAVDQIEMMQADISQSLTSMDTYNAFGQLSSDQLNTITSVKTMLFGEIDGTQIPDQIVTADPQEYYELEMSL